MIYGYARISTKQQSIERQVRNIFREAPDALIYEESYTGTTNNRPEWKRLLNRLKMGDTVIFDSVSRMSRNAEEGIDTYFDLYNKGIRLVFLKEHYIDTDIYSEGIKDKVELQGTIEDELFKGINNYFRELAKQQIKIAFEQSEKEVQDLRIRTKEGMETARLNGKQIGGIKGSKYNVKKSVKAKKIIMKHSKDFNGNLNDKECMLLAQISNNTYYKYKKEIIPDENSYL